MQLFSPVNVLGVVLSVIASMLLGFLWYRPRAFGTAWARLAGVRPDAMKSATGRAIAINAFLLLFLALALSEVLSWVRPASALEGLQIGLFLGIGFVATTVGTMYLFSGKTLRLFLIDVGYQVIVFGLMGLLLTLFR